jgi:DNA-binding LacI/PurR family transcriptional regulator
MTSDPTDSARDGALVPDATVLGRDREPVRRPSPRKTTIVDIAAASGVSVTTVSRILNDRPDVAEETRERVLRIMDDIGFAPQSAWRQIRSGRTGLIAMHVPPEFNPPSLRLIMSAALGVEEAGYSISIITRSLAEAELLAIFRGRQADGVILLEILAQDVRPVTLRDHGFPFVMIGHCADNRGMNYVDLDVEHGIGSAIDHLVEAGHRRIGLLTIDPVVQEKTYGFAAWTLAAFEAACTRHGIHPFVAVGEPTTTALTRAAVSLVGQSAISAIIAPQEQSVLGALKATQELGLQVPRDLSIVGMLSEPLGDLATPPLTTIDFPADEIGRVAARLLIEQLDGGRISVKQTLVRPELVLRGSTAPPRPERA